MAEKGGVEGVYYKGTDRGVKAGILNGECTTSIWDITTTKKILQTTNTVYSPQTSLHA